MLLSLSTSTERQPTNKDNQAAASKNSYKVVQDVEELCNSETDFIGIRLTMIDHLGAKGAIERLKCNLLLRAKSLLEPRKDTHLLNPEADVLICRYSISKKD